MKLNALTGLRFLAAAMILLFHLQGHFGISADAFGALRLSQGVSLFFVLSGFVLAYAYPKLLTKEEVGRFYLARFARVWPSHAMMLVVSLLVGTPIVLRLLVANAALVHSWIPSGFFFLSYNSVSWSLSTEFGFYLLFPLLIHNFARTWHWKIAASLLIATWLALAAGAYAIPDYDGGMHVDLQGLVTANPLARLFEFVLGMTMALAFKKCRDRVDMPWIVWALLEMATAALVIFNIWIIYAAAVAVIPREVPLYIWLGSSFSPALASAALLLVLALSRGPLAAFLSTRAMVYLGELSFSIYLVHQIVMGQFLGHPDLLAWMPPLAELPALFVAISLATVGLHYLVELPVQQAIRGLRGARPKTLPT